MDIGPNTADSKVLAESIIQFFSANICSIQVALINMKILMLT